MMTRRDLVVMLSTLTVAVGGMALAQENNASKVMGSSVFDWTQTAAKKTERGESRKFFRAPTATLDERSATSLR